MKMKIKVMGSYIIVLAALFFLSLFTIVRADGSLDHVNFIRNKVLVSLENMQQIEIDLIQVQLWLIDAGSTGGLDKFDTAEKSFIDANRLLDIEILSRNKDNTPALEKRLRDIKTRLQDYYEIGQNMAHTYQDTGNGSAKALRAKFDMKSIELMKLVGDQVKMHDGIFKVEFDGLARNQSDIIKILFGISLFIILIIIAMGIYISVSLNNGIKLVSGFSDKLSNNDITYSADINRKDEFGITANQFKGSFEKLNGLIGNIKKSTNTTADIKDSLAASAEETSATIVNIKNNTSSLLKEVENLDLDVMDNVASVEQITANINSIKDQINEQVAMVEESTSAITEMISSLAGVDNITRKKAESVNSLVQAIKGGNDASNATDQKFQTDVIDKIDGISEMANTIQAIASQTNLLSMNAAIEAAHAGDAGRGFAVVADEIRKLADTASRSSAEITKTIKEIAEGIAGTGIVAQRKIDAFVVMNREIKETKDAFDEIVTSVQELNSGGAQIQGAMVVLQDVSSIIKNAADEMTIGAEQVVNRQFGLKEISGNVTKGMLEISSGSEEIVIAADEIVKYSSDLNSIVDDLKEETDKFTT